MASTEPQECVYTEYDQDKREFNPWRKGLLQAWSTTWVKPCRTSNDLGVHPAAIIVDCEKLNVVVTLADFVSFKLDKVGATPVAAAS